MVTPNKYERRRQALYPPHYLLRNVIWARIEAKKVRTAERASARAKASAVMHTLRGVHAKMYNRLVVGALRYDNREVPYPVRYRMGTTQMSYLNLAKEALLRAQYTHNIEGLIDAMNYIALELANPCEDGWYFKAEDDNEYI